MFIFTKYKNILEENIQKNNIETYEFENKNISFYKHTHNLEYENLKSTKLNKLNIEEQYYLKFKTLGLNYKTINELKLFKKLLDDSQITNEVYIYYLAYYYFITGNTIEFLEFEKYKSIKQNKYLCNLLGCYYYNLRDDKYKMIKYMDYAISLGNVESMFEMGNFYYKQHDYILMKKYYFMAIKYGNIYAKYNLALYYYNCGNYYNMFKYLENCNVPEAFNLVGAYYYNKKNNKEMAIHFYKKAAEQHYIYSIISLYNLTMDIEYFELLYSLKKKEILTYYTYIPQLYRYKPYINKIGLCEIMIIILSNKRQNIRLPCELWQYLIHPFFTSMFFKNYSYVFNN